MKNLKLRSVSRKRLEHGYNLTSVIAIDDAFYLVQNGEFRLLRNNTVSVLSPESHRLVAPLEHLSFENKICLVSDSQLLLYDPSTEDLLSLPFDIPLECAAWNATQEILAVVHTNSDVATYSIDFESAVARCLEKSFLEAEVPQTVYVGWGSAETQFRGSEGKRKMAEKTSQSGMLCQTVVNCVCFQLK